METDTSKQVKLILKKKVDKKYGWNVPIIYQEERWWTGQDLTEKQMTGIEPLTAEQKVKYPYVINPYEHKKLQSGRNLRLDNPVEKALYDLCVLSEKIADCKANYNTSQHDGYFEDKEIEAKAVNKSANKKYLAYKMINEMPAKDLDSVVMMLNYTARKEDFYADLNASREEKLAEINDLIDAKPELVLNCSKEHNPNIQDDLFVMKLLHYKFVVKHGMDYYESDGAGQRKTFLGRSIESIKEFINSKGNISLRDKFQRIIEEEETGRVVRIPNSLAEEKVDKNAKIGMLKLQIKEALFDEDLFKSKEYLDKLLLLTSKSDPDYTQLTYKYNNLYMKIANPKEEIGESVEVKVDLSEADMNIIQDKLDKELASDLQLWNEMNSVELMKTINNPQNKDFHRKYVLSKENSKEDLLEYMMTARTNFLRRQITNEYLATQ